MPLLSGVREIGGIDCMVWCLSTSEMVLVMWDNEKNEMRVLVGVIHENDGVLLRAWMMIMFLNLMVLDY